MVLMLVNFEREKIGISVVPCLNSGGQTDRFGGPQREVPYQPIDQDVRRIYKYVGKSCLLFLNSAI